jgi:SAM-dependent methyltransferase
LRTRTERLFPFSDRGAVEACLERMGKRDQPLVRRLDRRPGQQDYRWVHELGPVDTGETPSRPAVDREAPIADSPDARDDRVRATYGVVAPAYARELSDELDGLPFERWLLDHVAAAVRDLPIMDAGCGPGHVTAYLAAAGAHAQGLDLSPEMIAEAQQRHPDVRYEVGDLRRLMRPAAAAGWGAVLGWYSLIHLAASELPGAVAALARPLAPGGLLVLALHAGADVRRVTSWFETEVPALDVVLHDVPDVVAAVQAAGLNDVEWYLRGPHEWRGETTQRLYVMARRA